jgi:hypothetical protein
MGVFLEDQEVKLEYQGGFVAELHRLAEAIYGPGSPLDHKGQVFEFLKHEILRNNGNRKPIGTSDIMKATGIARRQVEKALAFLIKGEFIVSHGRKTFTQIEKNSYELHPRLFGNDYVYNGIKKPLKLIQGGKKENNPPENKSYPADCKSYPQHIESDTPPSRQQWRHPTADNGGTLPPQNADFSHESDNKPSSTNPFNKPSLRRFKSFNFSEEEDPEEAARRNKEKYWEDKKRMGLE